MHAKARGHARSTRDERGSILIFALVFLTAVALTVLALGNWTLTNLHNTSRFSSVRQLQDAARSTTELAMQSIRYVPLLSTTQTLNANPPNVCWGSSTTSGLSIDGYSIDAWCSTVWQPESANTRIVTVSACQSNLSAAQCAATPYLQVVVTYDDYPPGGAAAVSGPCTDWNWCGQGMTIDSWTWA